MKVPQKPPNPNTPSADVATQQWVSTYYQAKSSATPQLDYVERTSNLAVTASTAATAQAWIDGNAIPYDGATRIKLEFFSPAAGNSGAAVNLLFELYDGATDLGILGQVNGAGATVVPAKGERFFTPSAGVHTFHVKAWMTGTSPTITGGSGGPGAYLPAWYRITRA